MVQVLSPWFHQPSACHRIRWARGVDVVHQHAPGHAAGRESQHHAPRQEGFSSPIPVPVLLQSRYVRPAFYSVTVVDGHGRIAATSPLRALGWTPGTVLEFRVDANRLISASRVEGPSPPASTAPRREVTPRGHLNLPAPTRRRADVITGDRLLTAADTSTGILWILPPKVIALILHAYTTDQDQPL